MELNGEIARGYTTWADRTASRLLDARIVNGTKGKKDTARRRLSRSGRRQSEQREATGR